MAVDRGASLEVTEVTSGRELEALRPEWDALWQRCPDATPFQSPDWLLAWWNHLGRGELLALILHHRGRLVGMAPLFIDSVNTAERDSSVRPVLVLGTGVTDHLDILVEPELAEPAAAAVLAHLGADAARWDVLDLHQLRPGAALLRAALPAGWTERNEPQESCPVLPLPARYGDLPAAGAGLAKRARYYRRRAERLAPLQFHAAGSDDVEPLLHELFRLHGDRWSARGQPGIFATEAARRFHLSAATGLAARGALRLYALRLGDETAAVFYGFLHWRRAYVYIAGFDPRFARLSLGTVLLAHAIEEAIREGAVEFDFLRGREPYKYRWGARDCWSRRRVLAHPHSRTTLVP